MRTIDERLIKQHADLRFRTEYDYALFEYYRSAKVFAHLASVGQTVSGRVLDAGCGGGGMPLSFAEEADSVAAIDLVNRFGDAGVRLAHERDRRNLHFLQADGQALPFRRSHLRLGLLARGDRARRRRAEVPARVRARAAAGRAHVSVDRALPVVCRRAPSPPEGPRAAPPAGRPELSFGTFRFLARHAEWTLREKADENSFIKIARRNGKKADDLLELVRIRRLRAQVAAAGFRTIHEDLYLTGTFRRLPRPLRHWVRDSPLTQDIVIGHVQYVLARD